MEARRRDRFDRRQTAAAEKTLRRVRELTHCPQALTPFLDALSQVFVDRQDVVHPKGVPTVGTYCVMVPPELIYAQGAMPVKLCGGRYGLRRRRRHRAAGRLSVGQGRDGLRGH